MGKRTEYETCARCKGSGDQVDGDRILTGIFTCGASLIVDAALGDDVVTEACRVCGGSGRVIRSIATNGDHHDEG